ncbi:NAD-dependent epimerase/dehydratase family protein [Nocardia sp. NPDC051570]|uniref:NAD-dependent epimerase/dehydratase family protein n=1 Tax=Nocardia sp. NPDC051570 TaxID=3364324 RepID=UPI003792B646
MRVLVTGAGGYLGRAVVEALRAAGHDPIAMVHSSQLAIPGASETRTADLLDQTALRQTVADVEAVCHLAGLTRARESIQEPLKYFRVNTSGTIALLEAMAASGVARLVFASTGAIYGTPERQPMTEDLPAAPPHPYASSKYAAELAIEAQAQTGEIAGTVVRLLNVAGGADPDPTRLVPRAITAALRNEALEVNGDGSAVRDYLHIADTADAFVACLEHLPPVGRTRRYNIGSGHGTSILEVVAAVENVTGKHVPITRNPPAAEPSTLVSDPSRAIAEISWAPTRSDIHTIVRDAWNAMSADPREALSN